MCFTELSLTWLKAPLLLYRCMAELITWSYRELHDDVIKWKHFPRHWPFVRGIRRSPVDSPHKGQWRGALVFSLMGTWTKDWTNSLDVGDLRRQGAHCDVTLMYTAAAEYTRSLIIVRRAGLLWSQQDFEWRWSVPLFKCLTVLEFSFILFDLCLLITFFNFIMNHVPIVTFWIFTYHKIWILSIMFCFIWSYWIIYFLACLEVSWRVVS